MNGVDGVVFMVLSEHDGCFCDDTMAIIKVNAEKFTEYTVKKTENKMMHDKRPLFKIMVSEPASDVVLSLLSCFCSLY